MFNVSYVPLLRDLPKHFWWNLNTIWLFGVYFQFFFLSYVIVVILSWEVYESSQSRLNSR